MTDRPGALSRRGFLASAAALAPLLAQTSRPALIAITIDLEMARHYPTWDQTEWDYEKGNLQEREKRYAVAAARQVKSIGGLIHFFVVGRVLEHGNVDWLKQIADAGHPIGNHTYDHINLRADRPEALQPRFRRAPWLIRGKTAAEVKAENILMTSHALKERIGVETRGFRAPGGFPEGLVEHPDVQEMFLRLGYRWVSTKAVNTPLGNDGYKPWYRDKRETEPPPEIYAGIVAAQQPSQPSVYRSGLIEIPMSPVSDLNAFRTGRWQLPHFLKSLRETLDHIIRTRGVFVFLGHPSCLSVEDPRLMAVTLIAEMVRTSNGAARLVDLDTIAQQVKPA